MERSEAKEVILKDKIDTLNIVQCAEIGKACVCGNFLFGSTTLSLIDVKGLWIGLLRNSLMSSVALLFIMDYLKISKQCLFAFAGVAAYWIFLIYIFPFTGYFFNTFIVYGVSFLPFIIALKNWSEKSWRKFLFA